MPLALDFSSTLVMGWILPVATTLLAMSLRVALASLLGSILLPLPRATATIATNAISTTAGIVQSHHFFFRLRCVVTQKCSRFLDSLYLNRYVSAWYTETVGR